MNIKRHNWDVIIEIYKIITYNVNVNKGIN